MGVCGGVRVCVSGGGGGRMGVSVCGCVCGGVVSRSISASTRPPQLAKLLDCGIAKIVGEDDLAKAGPVANSTFFGGGVLGARLMLSAFCSATSAALLRLC